MKIYGKWGSAIKQRSFAQACFLLRLYTKACLFLPHAPLGDIQVGMMDKKGQLEVEIIRARGLVVKPGSKTLPGKNRRDSSMICNAHFSIQRLYFWLDAENLVSESLKILISESVTCSSLCGYPKWACSEGGLVRII